MGQNGPVPHVDVEPGYIIKLRTLLAEAQVWTHDEVARLSGKDRTTIQALLPKNPARRRTSRQSKRKAQDSTLEAVLAGLAASHPELMAGVPLTAHDFKAQYGSQRGLNGSRTSATNRGISPAQGAQHGRTVQIAAGFSAQLQEIARHLKAIGEHALDLSVVIRELSGTDASADRPLPGTGTDPAGSGDDTD